MTDDAPESPDSGREESERRNPAGDTDDRHSSAHGTESGDASAVLEEPDAGTEPETAPDAREAAGSDTDGTPEPDVPDVTDETDEDAPPEDVDEQRSSAHQAPPEDVQKYERFTKMDGAQYDRVNEFLRDRTYITAREWAIARLCADFRTETGVEMTKIGENLPDLVPFMTDTYTPQAVNQARSSFKGKIRKSGATFLYGAMCNFFTAEELDEMMYEVTEVAKFLLEVEGVDLTVDEELEAEERISSVMREVRHSSEELRHDHAECPHCGGDLTDD